MTVKIRSVSVDVELGSFGAVSHIKLDGRALLITEVNGTTHLIPLSTACLPPTWQCLEMSFEFGRPVAKPKWPECLRGLEFHDITAIEMSEIDNRWPEYDCGRLMLHSTSGLRFIFKIFFEKGVLELG